jgi:hypothetical protein
LSLYAKHQRDNEICISLLEKKAKDTIKANATAEATLVLDAEVTATQQQLQDLIQCEAIKNADARCNTLHNELAELKKSMHSKN